MNVKKILAHLLAVTCLIVCHTRALSVPPEGCFECEEEVWEEVPCDQIPMNATTTTTTTTSTSTTTTTSTTPRPIVSTTEDPYRKCYCECKVGCKEFCRKVSVHPEPKKQILQVSKITEPISQGRLESTHYHQRELVQKSKYVPNYNPIFSESYDAKPPYYAKPTGAKTYAKAQTHLNPTRYESSYEAQKHQSPYYQPEASAPHAFPQPFANAYSRLSHGNNVKVSIATSPQYSSQAPVQRPNTGNHLPMSSSGGYDSVESYIKDIMEANPSSNYETYDGFGGHHFSMSFR